MERPSAFMHDLAVRVLNACRESDSRDDATVLVCDQLRASLGKLTGNEGFTALLRRAVALAAEDVPRALDGVSVGVDGRLEGLGSGGADEGRRRSQTDADAAAVAITSHLLHLLVTFIGESLTLRLLRQTWPGISVHDENPRIEADR